MKPIEFTGQNVRIAKNQPKYLTLPAHRSDQMSGDVTFCWQLSWSERVTLLLTGKLWHQVLTFRNPLQPQKLSIRRPTLEGQS